MPARVPGTESRACPGPSAWGVVSARPITHQLLTNQLLAELAGLRFAAPVTHVYNPLVYARAQHDLYWTRFGAGPREILLLGMNPGPWGMAQTGVPFGEISSVRDWLQLDAPIGKPAREHPKRPVTGLACPRREVSGARLWGWARDRFQTPERFFSRFFIANYCPLSFMESSGRNRTPDKLPRAERTPLFEACDRHLRGMVALLQPRWVIGVGNFATRRARTALADQQIEIGKILHPSPASPIANRGWAPRAMADLAALGIITPEDVPPRGLSPQR